MIRVANEGDAAGILEIYAPLVESTAISFELSPPSEDEMRQRIRDIVLTHAWVVAEEEGMVAGYAYASRFRPREAYAWTTEVTVYVHPGRQRRGLGRALYGELLERLRRQNFFTAIAVIALPNELSVKLHEAAGFEPVGVIRKAGYKFGVWHDTGWWQLELQPHGLNPAYPSGCS